MLNTRPIDASAGCALDLFLPRKIICPWRVYELSGKAPEFSTCWRRRHDRQESRINLF
jgi:hypothetical protein